MEEENEKLRQHIEEQDKEIIDLKELLDKAINDKEAVEVEHGDLKAQLTNIDIECCKLRETISDTKAENEYLIKEKDIVEQKVNQLGMTIDGLNADKEVIVDTFHKKLKTASEENEKLALELSSALASIAHLESKLEQQAQDISNLQETNKGLEATKTDLYNEVTIYLEDKTATLSQLEQLKAYVKNLESQLEQQMEKISHMEKIHDASIANFESKLDKQAKHISNLEETNKDLEVAKNDQYNDIKVHKEEKVATLDQLQQAEASLKNLENQLKKQKDKISDLQYTNEALVLANSNLQNEIIELEEEKNGMSASIADLESKLKEQDKHMSNLQDTNKDLEAAKDDLYNGIMVYQEEKNAALAQLQLLEASTNNLENKLAQQLDKTSNMEKTNEARVLENSNLKNEVIELQKEKNEAFATIADLERKLEQQVQQISNLQDTNKDLEVVKTDLYNEIMVYQEEKIAALGKLQQVEASMKNLESQLEHQTEKISHMESIHDDFIADLESKLEQQEKHILNLLETNKELEAAKTNLYNDVLVYQEEKTATLTKLEHVEASLKNVENQFKEQQEKISILQKTNEALVLENSNLQNEIIELREEKNGALAFIADLESKLERQTQHISNLQDTNKALEAAKADLFNKVTIYQEEKTVALAKLQQVEASEMNLASQLEQQLEKISHMEQTHNGVIAHLESKLEQQAKHMSRLQETNIELEATKVDLYNEVSVHQKEKTTALAQLQLSETSMKNLENQLAQQLERVSIMQNNHEASINDLENMLEQQARQISNIEETNKDLKVANDDLSNKVIVHQEEKIAALAQLKQLEASTKNLQDQLEQQLEKISVMQNTHVASISDLESKLEQQGQHLSTLEKTKEDLEVTKTKLYNEGIIHKEEKMVALDQLQHVEVCMKNLENQLLEKISVMQKTKKALVLENSNLQSEIMVLLGEKNEALASIADFKSKLEQQAQHVSNLHDTIKDLEVTNTDMSMEKTKLHKHVSDLGAQLQLVKQKLKVTEVENKWKEERYATTVETLQAEVQNLEQLVNLLEETIDEVKVHAESTIFSLAEKLDELESSFSQGFTRFVYRSSASNEEVKVLRKKLYDHLDEQKELLKKKDVLAIRLRDKENVLSEMVKNDVEARVLENEVQEKESEGDRTNYTSIFSRRWPILKRKGRRNSYSAGEQRNHQIGE